VNVPAAVKNLWLQKNRDKFFVLNPARVKHIVKILLRCLRFVLVAVKNLNLGNFHSVNIAVRNVVERHTVNVAKIVTNKNFYSITAAKVLQSGKNFRRNYF